MPSDTHDRLRIYFSGSIRGGRNDAAVYGQLIAGIADLGTVLTEHVGDAGLPASGDPRFTDQEVHDRDMAWLIRSDAVVAEITQPSLGVGYEVARAVAMAKPVLALYRDVPHRRPSAMICGCPEVAVYEYREVHDALARIREFTEHIATNTAPSTLSG